MFFQIGTVGGISKRLPQNPLLMLVLAFAHSSNGGGAYMVVAACVYMGSGILVLQVAQIVGADLLEIKCLRHITATL